MSGTARPCTGVILAGGSAVRLGGAPKGLLDVGGVRVLDRAAAALREAADALLLVAAAPDADTWLPDATCVRDAVAGRGPLEGVRTAIEHAGTAVLVVAWDMPFVPASLLVALRRLGEASASATVPEGPLGPEPLCAYYPAACLPALRRLLDGGERRASALLSRVGAITVPASEVRGHGDPAWMFASVNTPDDLARARARAGVRA